MLVRALFGWIIWHGDITNNFLNQSIQGSRPLCGSSNTTGPFLLSSTLVTETWNRRDRDSKKWVSSPRPSLEAPPLLIVAYNDGSKIVISYIPMIEIFLPTLHSVFVFFYLKTCDISWNYVGYNAFSLHFPGFSKVFCAVLLLLSDFFFYPLLSRATRCWAAIRLSHCPGPSGCAVHGEVDGLDVGGQHGRRFVLLRHTHRLQRRPHHICTTRSGNVRHRCSGGWAGPRLFLGGSFRGCGYRCRRWKCRVLWGCPLNLHSIGDPPTVPHVCCCQKNWWVVVWWVQMGASIWGTMHLHSIDWWALSGTGVQTLWHGVLEIVWLHCDEAHSSDVYEDWKVVCWCRTQAFSQNLQGVVDGGVDEVGMSATAPNRSAVLCNWMHQGQGGCSQICCSNSPTEASKPPQVCNVWC